MPSAARPGRSTSQLWGGIVINGNGHHEQLRRRAAREPANATFEARAGLRFYGGNDNAESSGILRYVVVKHAGFEVRGLGDELNGVTFNAVGSGTIVENLEIYSGYDDGIEFFGGAVNITNYVALYVRDDSIDFSDGYVGTIKNALGHPCADRTATAASRATTSLSRIANANPAARARCR